MTTVTTPFTATSATGPAADDVAAIDADSAVPLVVDVDGTLIKSDLLFESVLQVVAHHPFLIWRLPLWLAGGKASLKTALAHLGDPGTQTIPLREEVVRAIRKAQEAGRPVYLASASDRRLVQKLADRVGGIAGVFATDATVNLSGKNKADCLVAQFGAGRFDYIGDAPVDFAVWRAARKVLALTHSSAFERRLVKQFPNAQIVGRPRPSLKAYANALRPHQWAKNALVFLPLVAGHYFEWPEVMTAILAFIAFSIAASSAYLINDLLDLPGDRDHPRKRRRPFASGTLPVQHGVILAGLLIPAAFVLALSLPSQFILVLALYLFVTLAYSMVLKRKIVVDVVTLGGLYTLRVVGGIAAIGAEYSQWLLMFCLFLFLSLAIVKRCSELIAREKDGKRAPLGRGYRFEDLRALFGFGAAAGYGAVFVVALYLASPEVQPLYQHSDRLWLVCPFLLYWITRIFLISNRGELHDDPLVFALTDRTSWAAALGIVGIVAAAI